MNEREIPWWLPGWETADTQRSKLPARGSRKPNADELAGDKGDDE
jgi:hypothetical protein